MDVLETKHQPRSKVGLCIIAFFRYVVLCSGAIACYCLCYLAYEHNEHYCSINPWNCTEAQKKNIKVPWAIVLFISTCVASTLESLFSTWFFLNSDRQQLNYARLLVTTTPVTLFFLISYWMFYSLPGVILPCPWGPNNTNRNVRLSPETFDCCISLGVLTAGGIAVFFQLLITVIAGMVVGSSRLQHKKITLAEISSIITATLSDEKSEGDEEREVLLIV